jgi:transposase
VIRHIRPKLSCRSCERILQAPMPDLPIEKGRPGPGLVANVVVGKYLAGLPLYRQSAIPGFRRGRLWRARASLSN